MLSPTYFDTRSRLRSTLPSRPDPGVLNRAIPLFFIGRNRHGFWLAREASGRVGGIFLLRRSALRFAQEASTPRGCATMFPGKTFELDTRNCGNPLAQWLDAALRVVGRFIPDRPPPIPISNKYRGKDWF